MSFDSCNPLLGFIVSVSKTQNRIWARSSLEKVSSPWLLAPRCSILFPYPSGLLHTAVWELLPPISFDKLCSSLVPLSWNINTYMYLAWHRCVAHSFKSCTVFCIHAMKAMPWSAAKPNPQATFFALVYTISSRSVNQLKIEALFSSPDFPSPPTSRPFSQSCWFSL